MKNLILMAMLLLTMYGCGSSTLNVDFHVPSIRFQSPETTGKTLGLKAQVSHGSAHKVSLARSRQAKSLFSSNPGSVTIDTTTEYSSSHHLGYGFNLGLIERLDVYITKRGETNFKGGLQGQVFGPTGIDKAGFKISLAASAGANRDDEISTADAFEDPEKFDNVSGITHTKAWDAAVIAGYRFNKQAMLYLNGWYEENEVESTISVESQSTQSLDNRFKAKGILLGTILQKESGDLETFVQLEVGKSIIENRFGLKGTRTAWGLGFGATY